MQGVCFHVVMICAYMYMYTHVCMHCIICICKHQRSHALFEDRCLLIILEISFHDLHYISSLPHPFSSLSPIIHTAVHMHGDCYVTCMFDLFYSSTPYQYNVTPLYAASHNGHHDVVQTLVGAGADLNIARSDVSDMVLCSYICKVHAF